MWTLNDQGLHTRGCFCDLHPNDLRSAHTTSSVDLNRDFFAPGERLTVPFRGDLIWFVLHVVLNSRGMTTSNSKFRRFAAVETKRITIS